MKRIRFELVSKQYQPNGPSAVDCVNLDVPAGSLVVLLGPSGCGKTTLLKMVNRLVEPTSGTVYLGDTDVRSLEKTALRRQIGYVIQQVGLFPHMTLAQNIAVVPELLGWGRGLIHDRTLELLDLVRLPADLLDRYPSQLSGGQQQRVGIARALAADPDVLLMDEPFGAIDAINRTRLQDELASLQQRLKKTVLFVTHDVDEALRLADAIVVLRAGRVVQYDSPCGLLNHPADTFVRELIDADDLIRQLGLIRVETVMRPVPAGHVAHANTSLPAEATLRQALSLMLTPAAEVVTVLKDGDPAGILTIDDLRSAACGPQP